MPSLSSGINIALQAVLSQSQSIEVIEHNVANADTQGYHRQSAVLAAKTTNPSMSNYYGVGAGQLGAGVSVDRIQRFSLDFFDGRYRSISAGSKSWEYQSGILSQVESTLSDLSDDGLMPKLDEFWLAWQNLASDPTNSGLRTAVLNDASSLAEKFNRSAQQLIALRQDQNLTVQNRVSEINSLAETVASLNVEISRVTAVNQQPNDLLDQRDLALDRLAELTGAVSYTQSDGEVIVSISGHVLVTGQDAFALKTEADPNPANSGVDRIVWEADARGFTPNGGELEGILKVRDYYIPNQLSDLNKVAETLIEQVNSLHTSGYDLNGDPGKLFFSGSNSLDISVNSELNPENLAISSSADEVGNNDIAAKIVGLRDARLMASSTQTLGEYYNNKMSALALVTKQSKDNTTQFSAVMKALDTQRQSVSGVSLDEEAANLAKAQKAYQAAARVMTAYDDLLDRVINQMGLVGR